MAAKGSTAESTATFDNHESTKGTLIRMTLIFLLPQLL